MFMSNKIYVGNLSYNLSNTQLEDIFAPYGSVQSARIIMDRDTGRSKGFGFVEMSSSSEAQEAVSSLDGTEADGRNLKVNIAEDRAPKTKSFSKKW